MYEGSRAIYGVPECGEAPPTGRPRSDPLHHSPVTMSGV